MNIEQKVREIVQIIRNTREYDEVQRTKKILSRYPNLMKQVKKFQEKQKYFYKQRMSMEEEEKEFEQLYQSFDEIAKRREVKLYIQAMQKLNQRIYLINQLIYKDIEDEIMI